jgi:RNA polymerase nonessential primary-like sigma factor
MSDRDRRRTLASMLGELTDRERDILSRRYGLGLPEPETLQVISDELGISRERVRQIEKTALRKLQNRFENSEDAFGA